MKLFVVHLRVFLRNSRSEQRSEWFRGGNWSVVRQENCYQSGDVCILCTEEVRSTIWSHGHHSVRVLWRVFNRHELRAAVRLRLSVFQRLGDFASESVDVLCESEGKQGVFSQIIAFSTHLSLFFIVTALSTPSISVVKALANACCLLVPLCAEHTRCCIILRIKRITISIRTLYRWKAFSCNRTSGRSTLDMLHWQRHSS